MYEGQFIPRLKTVGFLAALSVTRHIVAAELLVRLQRQRLQTGHSLGESDTDAIVQHPTELLKQPRSLRRRCIALPDRLEDLHDQSLPLAGD